jgi:hypothetical protein
MIHIAQDTSTALFEAGSEQNHIALEHLSELLKDIGFSVRKKNRSESTLRVYPKKQNQYPLLNPRFVRSARSLGQLEITVLSKGDSTSLDTALTSFQSTPACSFSPLSNGSQGFRYHGKFIVPFTFSDNADTEQAMLAEVSQPLTEIHRFLVAHS